MLAKNLAAFSHVCENVKKNVRFSVYVRVCVMYGVCMFFGEKSTGGLIALHSARYMLALRNAHVQSVRAFWFSGSVMDFFEYIGI